VGAIAVANKHPSKSRNGKAAEASTLGVYFLSLSLENVRCFGPKQTLDLSNGVQRPARWTILLGNNGAGKTTVLQALAQVMAKYGDFRVNFHRFARVGQESWAIRADRAQGIGLSGASPMGPSRVECYLGKTLPSTRPAPPPDTPGCFGYGASRRLGRASSFNEENDTPSASLFSPEADLRDAEDWLLRVDYSASKPSEYQPKWQRRREQLTGLLKTLLPEVSDLRFTLGTGVYPAARVDFETPYGWVPLRQLGYGYQTLIAWVVDFASRMVERYPDSPDPLAEPAVVLVDEIDLHLHPVWQRKLIADLTERFPNTQFIATAHSPLVIQAAGDANLAVLRREGDHVVIDNERDRVRGWRVDQILTSDLFGLPSARPPDMDAPLQRRTELLTKQKLSAAEKRELAKLEKQLSGLPVGETAEQIETMALMRETLDRLRKELPPEQ
jgi:energy-coupling factor transporter ATP-binding protein EcfA2